MRELCYGRQAEDQQCHSGEHRAWVFLQPRTHNIAGLGLLDRHQ